MTTKQLYRKIHGLNPALKKEANDFIDFLLSKQKKNKTEVSHPQFGCAKGRFKMSADFDEPLDDFKDYMN